MSAKLCKSCQKQAKTLHHGYCEKCLAINVVKDWWANVGGVIGSMVEKLQPDLGIKFTENGADWIRDYVITQEGSAIFKKIQDIEERTGKTLSIFDVVILVAVDNLADAELWHEELTEKYGLTEENPLTGYEKLVLSGLELIKKMKTRSFEAFH